MAPRFNVFLSFMRHDGSSYWAAIRYRARDGLHRRKRYDRRHADMFKKIKAQIVPDGAPAPEPAEQLADFPPHLRAQIGLPL